MIDHAFLVLGFAAAAGSGLIAGLLFAFSVAVMAALARLPAPQGIAAMQSINRVIVNPLFGLVFFGTGIACLALAVDAFTAWAEPEAPWLVAGGALYLAGVIGVTMAFNVPLNDRLAALDPASAGAAALWNRYCTVWSRWNHVRVAAGTAALLAFIVAIAHQMCG